MKVWLEFKDGKVYRAEATQTNFPQMRYYLEIVGTGNVEPFDIQITNGSKVINN